MSKVLQYLPELEDEEQLYVAQLLKDMTEKQAQQFAHVYLARRRDPMHILLLALAGFVGIAGAHRFYLEQIGMGGLCVIGTIIDLVNYKDLAFRYNRSKADEVAALVDDAPADENGPPSFDA